MIASYSGSQNCPDVLLFWTDGLGAEWLCNPWLWFSCPTNYTFLALQNLWDYVIWIKTHGSISKTILKLIGTVLWAYIILLSSTWYNPIFLDNCLYTPGYIFYEILTYFWSNSIPLINQPILYLHPSSCLCYQHLSHCCLNHHWLSLALGLPQDCCGWWGCCGWLRCQWGVGDVKH